QDVAVFPARGPVHERTELAFVESLIAFEHRWNLADLNRRLALGVRLDPENVDRVSHARAVPVTDENAVARNPETASVARALEVAAFPLAGRFVLDRRHGDDPMQVHEIPKQAELLFEQRGARASVLFRRGRIEVAR